MIRSQERVRTKPSGKRWRAWQMFPAGKACKLVQRRAAIADDAGSGRQHRPHPLAMFLCLAWAAEYRVSDRDQVVHQIDRLDVRIVQPVAETRRVEPGVPDIEIEAAVAAISRAAHLTKSAEEHRSFEVGRRRLKQREQFPGGIGAEDPAETVMLHDGLRPRCEMPQISETHPIDPGRQPPSPAAPDQSADVEQDRGVMCHSRKLE